MFQIGSFQISSPTVLAPMAGVTDLPFRRLCHRMGAGLVVGEMLTSDISLWETNKSKYRLLHDEEVQPRSIQIAGGDAEMLANAAKMTSQLGAQIIDINMGCPAKKVCKKAAGSALMKDEKLVAEILTAVVESVDLPVTLKIRTGWDKANRNGLTIARMAEDLGIQALAVHGRTRECKYEGQAEYDTIQQIVSAVKIPVIANGDIDSPKKAKQVLEYTGAAGVMLGRAAQGRPWLFREVNHYIAHNELLDEISLSEQRGILLEHVAHLHEFYGPIMGPRIARKHVGWYLKPRQPDRQILKSFNKIDDGVSQLEQLAEIFDALTN